MTRSREISRRTLLRGLGTSLALPLLECMQRGPAWGAVTQPLEDRPLLPRRMAFLYVPNGMHMPDWTPLGDSLGHQLPSILQPLQPVASEINVLSGLTLDGGRPHGDGPGDHARSVASFLTGAHPRKTEGANIENGISVDQVAALQLGEQTRFASLQLGCEPSAQAGRCDSGYSCVYTSNVSWRSAVHPLAKEINPRAAFDRLFGADDVDQRHRQQAVREARRQSILDFVAEDARSLERQLGGADRHKLDEYLYAVRQIERRIIASQQADGDQLPVPDYPRPTRVPAELTVHAQLMMDIMVLAFQTDSTRIATMMYANAGSNRGYSQIDVPEGHHDLSHHGNDRQKQAKVSKINQYHVSLLAYFLDRLHQTQEGEGSLLDQCMVVYGSGIADGNSHNHESLPILMAGRAGGVIRTGRHLQYPSETPLTNLYLTMLRQMGVSASQFSDSTGELDALVE